MRERVRKLARCKKHVEDIKTSLEIIYEVKLVVDFEIIQIARFYPTEGFLEKDKLALIFMKIITEGYDVPIVVVENRDDYFVLDGHHRSFIAEKLFKKL